MSQTQDEVSLHPRETVAPKDWELDEMQRASRRHQRETVPYPSQMNSARDNFEDLYPYQRTQESQRQGGGSHA